MSDPSQLTPVAPPVRTRAISFAPIKFGTNEAVNGFEAWIAVWKNRDRGEVIIGASTLDALQDRWEQLTSQDFNRDRAQHVVLASHAHVKAITPSTSNDVVENHCGECVQAKAREWAADLDTVASNLTGDAESHTVEECARIVADIAMELRKASK